MADSEAQPLLSEAADGYGSQQQQQQQHYHGNTASISYHNLHYSVPIRQFVSSCCRRRRRKAIDILRDVNGVLPAGMNAIMGPTGSGKTTLLDAIAGRKDPKRLRGAILINGTKQPKNFKCISGYVVQDDALMPTLTVRENLQFSAALRLPATVRESDRQRRVDRLLDELGLEAVADQKIGGGMLRGVSGGERKRTSIGMEIVFEPQVLFLDEPTTGLDASTAQSVMELLHKLANKGRTIVFSIHQPRYSIFRTFDTLTILSKGETVYHGAAQRALGYFEAIGYRCEQFNNPLDLFLDIVNGDVLPIEEAECKTSIPTERELGTKPEVHSGLVAAFGESDIGQQGRAQAGEIFNEFQRLQSRLPSAVKARKVPNYQTSFIRQFRFVATRAFLNLLRNPQTSVAQVFVNVIFSVIVGTIYLQLPADLVSGVQNRVGVFFFMTMSMMFSNMNAVELFIHERVIFAHENTSGYYRVSVYFLTKVLCDLLPLRLLPLVVYAPVSYFMIGLEPQATKFLFFFLNLFVVSFAGASIAFFISASVSIFAVASILLAMCFVFMMVFAGLLVNLDTMADWLSWLRYSSAFRYSMNALAINELKDKKFCNFTIDYCTLAGNDYLDHQGIPYQTDFDLWFNEIALAAIVLVFLSLGYVQLRRLYKYK